MPNPELYSQLIAEANRLEASIEKARQEFERTQEKTKEAVAAIRAAAVHLRPPPAWTALPSSQQTIAALQEPQARAPEKERSFIDVVDEALKDVNANITTSLAFERLSSLGVPMGEDPRTKISTALARLHQRGTFVRSIAGGIGKAHTYDRANAGGEKG